MHYLIRCSDNIKGLDKSLTYGDKHTFMCLRRCYEGIENKSYLVHLWQ